MQAGDAAAVRAELDAARQGAPDLRARAPATATSATCRCCATSSLDEVPSLKGPEVLRTLDVTLLHALIIEEILGIDRAAQEKQTNLRYVKDTGAALARRERSGGAGGVPHEPDAGRARQGGRRRGEVMPQKSTFFYPKLASGLVINPIVPSEERLSDRRTTQLTRDPILRGRLTLVAAARRLSLLDRSAAARRLRAAAVRARRRPLRRLWASSGSALLARDAGARGDAGRAAAAAGASWRAAQRRRQRRRRARRRASTAICAPRCAAPARASTSPSPIRRIARSTRGRRRPTARWRSRSTSCASRSPSVRRGDAARARRRRARGARLSRGALRRCCDALDGAGLRPLRAALRAPARRRAGQPRARRGAEGRRAARSSSSRRSCCDDGDGYTAEAARARRAGSSRPRPSVVPLPPLMLTMADRVRRRRTRRTCRTTSAAPPSASWSPRGLDVHRRPA